MLVKRTPIVPSPSQEAIQSTDERPGKLKTGLIILVSREPKNSSNPKSNIKGNSKPANKNTANKIGRRSYNKSAPVLSEYIASLPILKKVANTITIPITLVANQTGVTSKRFFKYPLFIINFGLNIFVIIVIKDETVIKIVIINGKNPSNKVCTFLEKNATGIVTSPPSVIGVINNNIPINDGIKNFRKFLREYLFAPLSLVISVIVASLI
ncbi:hypothetical protein SDC9_175203 [bioreactor metagenome]|uniref:Uncharacterized protein n=1 Tax=bioreactor metagenome TaxID=1076179 RepID=A0A645GPE3_9ZZZZ